MVFAEWTVVANESEEMTNFTKLSKDLHKKNWCWFSCSMKLINHWTSKFNYKQKLNKLDLLDKINFVLDMNKAMDILFTDLANVKKETDEPCSSLANSKGIELLLNEKLNPEKFYYFYVDVVMRNIFRSVSDFKCFIDNDDAIYNYSTLSYELVEQIIDRFNCPLIVSIMPNRKGGFIKTNSSEFANLKPPIIGHTFLISAINKETKEIRLENSNPDKFYPRYINISQKDFNECCINFFGVVNDFNFFNNIK